MEEHRTSGFGIVLWPYDEKQTAKLLEVYAAALAQVVELKGIGGMLPPTKARVDAAIAAAEAALNYPQNWDPIINAIGPDKPGEN